MKNLWRYITEIVKLVLIIGRLEYILEDLNLYIYREISFADDLIIYISIGGHVVFLVGCPVIWKSKKQTIVMFSIIEVEFINFIFTIKNV